MNQTSANKTVTAQEDKLLSRSMMGTASIIGLFTIITVTGGNGYFLVVQLLSLIMLLMSLVTVYASVVASFKIRLGLKVFPILCAITSLIAFLFSCFFIAWFSLG